MARDNWGSKFGFIMAAAGSAVGLGNIWRFPYLTGENGGGAFVFVYILCVLLVGAPLLFNEIGLGRFTRKNPVGAFQDTGGSKLWVFGGGILSLCVSFFVLTYYGVIAGWTIGYMFTSLFGIPMDFDTFRASPAMVLPLFGLFMALSAFIVLGGVSKGIERAAKIMMPVLFLLLIVVIIRSVTLPGAMEGIKYYLVPDFSKIDGGTVLRALGQAFFSMSIGWGMMITYGSYLSKESNIVSSGLWVGVMDTGVALLGGLMIFPAVFAFGKEPNQGFTLAFQILPEIFNSLPAGGNIIGAFFFLLLCLAALTSSIAMIEVPAAYLIDNKGWNRKKAAWVVGVAAAVIGIPSALSSGGSELFSDLSITAFGNTYRGFMDIMDFVFGTFCIVIVALMTCLYTGWVMDITKISAEIGSGAPVFGRKLLFGLTPATIWTFFIRFVCPAVIGLVLINMMGVF